MFIAKIENGNVVAIGDYRELFPNTCFSPFGPDEAWFEENSCKRVNLWKAYNALTEKLVSCAPYIEGEWVFTVAVEPQTEEDIQAQKDAKWAQIRSERNRLLADCDWTQLADAPVDKAAWATYRQALRDITSQTNPFEVVWPKNPSFVEEKSLTTE